MLRIASVRRKAYDDPRLWLFQSNKFIYKDTTYFDLTHYNKQNEILYLNKKSSFLDLPAESTNIIW